MKEKWTLEQKLKRFKEVHGSGTYNLVENLIGKEVDKEFFVISYIAVSESKRGQSEIKRNARHTYDFLVNEGFFKANQK